VRVVDDLAVAFAILVSLVYALLALGPRGLRARLTGGKAGGACGGCDNCGSETTPPEVRIPLSKIGRR
jgi:hypothetical protein